MIVATENASRFSIINLHTMKFSAIRFSLFSLVLIFPLFLPTLSAHHEAQRPGRWEKLGQRQVNFRVDRDVIQVGAREGRFKALQLKVKGGAIDLNRVVVHYRNGDEQVLNVRQNIPRGGQTRVLDLPGNNRIITKVVFVYDTRNRSRRRATVELWGRH